ncbi:MAG TPA: methyltransferase domain-containing protein [Burkholderiales bacterium]
MLVADNIRIDAKHIERRRRNVERQLAFLRPRVSLESVVMEVGCGDCTLARKLAGYVERVYALEASEDLMGRLGGPPNLVRMVYDGVRIPVPEASVDLAFSARLVLSQLPGICRALKDGGTFWTSAKGRASEIRAVLLDAGFSAVRFYVGALRVPYPLARVLDDPFRIAIVK